MPAPLNNKNASKRLRDKLTGAAGATLNLYCFGNEKNAWVRACSMRRETLSSWTRQALNNAARAQGYDPDAGLRGWEAIDAKAKNCHIVLCQYGEEADDKRVGLTLDAARDVASKNPDAIYARKPEE